MKYIFMPKCTEIRGAMKRHFLAYKRFVENGNLIVTHDIKRKCEFTVSHYESWDVYDPYFKEHKITHFPKSLCDKADNTSLFKDAGMNVLNSTLLSSLRSFNNHLDNPIIIKPRLSAGSSGDAFCYKIYDDALNVRGQAAKLTSKRLFDKSYIIQDAIAKAGEPYGQLYVEGFVNGKGEIFFSSIHEIEFVDGRWIAQLEWNKEDDSQVEQIKENLRNLVKNSGVRNTLFLLQLLRNFKERVWYPTDWQYRLSYNSLWGRIHFEPDYCSDCVKFMSDQVDEVKSTTKLKYYQSYVKVSVLDKSHINSMMKKYDIVSIPFAKNNKDAQRKFLFITAAETYEKAKENMMSFAKVI